MGGELYDEVYMDYLASEFESPVPGRVFAPETSQELRPAGGSLLRHLLIVEFGDQVPEFVEHGILRPVLAAHEQDRAL